MADRPEPISVIIVGAGGFGREVLQYLKDAVVHRPEVSIKGFLDDNPLVEESCLEIPLLGARADYEIQDEDRFIVSIGNPEGRSRVIREMETDGARFFTLVHPTAHIAKTATIGEGCIICPFCAVGNMARLEDHVVMTWYSSVAHDAYAAPFSVFSPYSTINGHARVGTGVFLGAHAVVNPLQVVGDWSRIAAGAIVYKEVPPGRLAMGNPAKTTPLMQGSPEESPTRPASVPQSLRA